MFPLDPFNFTWEISRNICCCCLPMAELVYLTLFTVFSGAPNTQSARQTSKYCFLVGHACCIRNIPQCRLIPAEYRQLKLPSSYQLYHYLVFRHLSQVMKNPPCSGFEPRTSRIKVRRSNLYTIELCIHIQTFHIKQKQYRQLSY
jgi:hypothetical protein